MSNNRELSQFGSYVTINGVDNTVGIATTVNITSGSLFVGGVEAIKSDGTWGGSSSGLQGLQGTQGTQGLQGLKGEDGIIGVNGSQGTQGTQGIQGIQGTDGTQGTQGTTGTQGIQGTQGLTGPVAGSNTQIIFNNNNVSAGATNFVYDPVTQNVGIGTTNPTSKLTVQGDVLISGITTSGITRINSSTASPNASTPVATLEAVGSSTNYDIAIVPKGSGAIVASIPDGTATGGNKRGTYAVDLQLSRSTATKVASGSYCFIGGGNGNTASLLYSVVTGGNSNTASSSKCFIGGGETNTVSASFGVIVGGQSNTINTGSYSFIGGGDSHTTSSDYATIAGGTSNTASGQYSSVLGGRFSIANKNYSSVIGGYGANTRNTNGAVAFAGANTTFGAGSGVALQQARFAILSKETTDATLSILTADGSASYTNNVLQVATKSAYLVKGSVIAYSNASDIARAWEFTAAIKNTSGTTLVGTPIINDIAYDSGASGWNLSITADAGTSSLKVEVTGQASTTIRWVTKIDSTEVAFQ